MRIIRFQGKRLAFLVCGSVLLLLIALSLWISNSDNEVCVVPLEVHQKIGKMAEQLEEALTALKLTYFLCYNSLWGALKIKGPLPWHNKLELCVLNDELSNIDEGFLARTFKRYGLKISYSSADGTYQVILNNDSTASATLTVFEEDSLTHQMRRVGWKHRVLPPDSCELLHCFPPSLISEPLPEITFLGHKLPAPREEIEIQKYLFPDTWWKDINPPNCREYTH